MPLSISNRSTPTADLMSFDTWLEEMGISPATGWRWRKRNWVSTTNINGRVYVRRSEIIEFERRANAGEFSKQHKTPSRKKAERTFVPGNVQYHVLRELQQPEQTYTATLAL